MQNKIVLKVKEENKRLIKANFIRIARYVEWLSNIVMVRKKNKKIRVCIDFRNLNTATPKDEYPMPVTNLLTAFRCLGSLGTFELVVMPFSPKNTGTTYQQAMNFIFHDLLGKKMEVYIDDVDVKSQNREKHIEELKQTFARIREHGLKMNPPK
ncbi:hypothetical protein CRG98_015975 [Punica granatum]|uniref:Reverse transcriptase domain-containing protein n=1 Tax=Punica granatum TaxID=22663 RepID=A0A2I0K4X6_PUNGR|nr:hypothetical protein CRG98_015975 [Punica granatum]